MSKEMKTLNGYEVVDASARERITILENNSGGSHEGDSFFLDCSAATSVDQVVPESFLPCLERWESTYESEPDSGRCCIYVKTPANPTFTPAYINNLSNQYKLIVGSSCIDAWDIFAEKAIQAEQILITKDTDTNVWSYRANTAVDTITIATKDMLTDYQTAAQVQTIVDNAIAAITDGEEVSY